MLRAGIVVSVAPFVLAFKSPSPLPVAIAAVPASYMLLAGIPGAIDWGLVVLIPACLFVAWRAGTVAPGRSPLDAPVAAFVAVWWLAGLLSGPWTFRIELWLPIGVGVLLYWLTSRSTVGGAYRAAFRVSFGVASLVLAGWLQFTRLLARDADPQAWIGQSGNLLFVVPNDVILLVLASLLSVGNVAESNLAQRTIGVAAVTCALLLAVQLESRGAVLALLVGLATSVAVASQWRLAGGLFALSLALLALMELVMGSPLIGKFRGLFDDRLLLWASAWQQFLDQPWFGNGPYSFGTLHRAPAGDSVRFLGQFQAIDPRNMPWPHNLLLEILAAGGIAAALAAGWVIVRAGRILAWMHESRREPFRALAPVTAALAVAALYELSLIRLWVVGMLACILGVLSSQRQKETR